MANITSDLKKTANNAASDFSSKMQSAENQVGKMVYDSGERIGAFASDIANSTLDKVKAGKDYVQDNPYKGIAIAAAAGLVAGALLTSISRSRH